MPKYFIPKVYLHLLLGTAVTFASSEYPIGSGLPYMIGIIIGSFGALFALFALSPGPLKYAVATVLCALLGQSMSIFMERLKQKDLLANTLIGTLGVFTAMSAVGFYDNQNLLGFGPYLLAALVGLLIAHGIAFLVVPHSKESDPTAKTMNTVLSWVTAILFSAFTAYDTQRLKEEARSNKAPDYINSSLGLYLDFLNLFEAVGSLEQ